MIQQQTVALVPSADSSAYCSVSRKLLFAIFNDIFAVSFFGTRALLLFTLSSGTTDVKAQTLGNYSLCINGPQQSGAPFNTKSIKDEAVWKMLIVGPTVEQ
ncbi:hypothetical protein XENORESO_002270 [Xenotaenia resolanae]|uniref:Uncharacterized protein n=1 Tax=Xenotaenia resolanae TaxID=208358 RepID=A0ABV0VUC1_9TELE